MYQTDNRVSEEDITGLWFTSGVYAKRTQGSVESFRSIIPGGRVLIFQSHDTPLPKEIIQEIQPDGLQTLAGVPPILDRSYRTVSLMMWWLGNIFRRADEVYPIMFHDPRHFHLSGRWVQPGTFVDVFTDDLEHPSSTYEGVALIREDAGSVLEEINDMQMGYNSLEEMFKEKPDRRLSWSVPALLAWCLSRYQFNAVWEESFETGIIQIDQMGAIPTEIVFEPKLQGTYIAIPDDDKAGVMMDNLLDFSFATGSNV